MPLGGFAPCPIRLGGTDLDGITAAQFKRLTGDISSCRKTAGSAFFHISKSGSSVTITNYYGENGNGPNAAPTATVNGTGDVTLTFDPPAWKDELNQYRQIIVRGGLADPTSAQRQATLEHVDDQTVRLRTWGATGGGAPADADALVELWFDRDPRIGDYGGDVDKADSEIEGKVPRAWSIYREIQQMRGDAYSKERSGYVHVEHLAWARHLAWAYYRLPEEAVNNQTPSRADALLGYWVRVLNIQNSSEDRKADIRKRCAVKYERLNGSTRSDIDKAFAEQLGSDLVDIVRNLGNDLDNPPDITYWPGINPGPSYYNIGGGTWSSYRSHIFFVLSRALLANRENLNLVANRALFNLADDILPVWCTFSWYLEGSGFIIGESLLGFDAFGDG